MTITDRIIGRDIGRNIGRNIGMTARRWPWVICASFLFVLFVVWVAPVRADSWNPPETKQYFSENKTYRFTVVPREIGSSLDYFEKKVANTEFPEQGNATGTLEVKREGKWVKLWSKHLTNEVAPVSVLVSNDGRSVVTFDNWHSMGYGDNVVVIYGPDGGKVRSLSLRDIAPEYVADAFTRSVSSIWWRRDAAFSTDGQQLDVPLLLHLNGDLIDGKTENLIAHINLADGSVALDTERLSQLQPQICVQHVEAVSEFNAWRDDYVSPLRYPTDTSNNDIESYYTQAVWRLRAPKAASSESEKQLLDDVYVEPVILLNPGDNMEKEFRESFRESLLHPDQAPDDIWLAALDQNILVKEILAVSKDVAPRSLTNHTLYVFADDEHWPSIQSAMAPSGATLIQVNPNTPIPQRPEELAQIPPTRVVDTACRTP